ncbi:MAG: SUMF1/EgtB/PvdO family nonheme iron enzyme, partial [Thermomonas sp.]
MRKALATLLLVALPLAGLAAASLVGRYAGIPGGRFKSVLGYEDAKNGVDIRTFALMRTPVTNGEFLAFVKRHPEWRRDRVAGAFAESRYLSHWAGADTLGPNALPDRPVVWVSWFAAEA